MCHILELKRYYSTVTSQQEACVLVRSQITILSTTTILLAWIKNNVRDLYHFSPEQYHHKIKLFLNSVDGYEGMDVPDPWYTGDFDTTERLVDLGTSSWLKIIENE